MEDLIKAVVASLLFLWGFSMGRAWQRTISQDAETDEPLVSETDRANKKETFNGAGEDET